MILRPAPGQAGACPRDGVALDVESLHVPNGRALVVGRCPRCGRRMLQDLPVGHGLLYPTTVDLESREVFGMWFGEPLREAWEAPDREPVGLRVERRAQAGDVVLLHCLDFVYGHALLRLLNAQRHLDAGEALVALVPASLEHLVPEGVAEAWVYDGPLGRLRGWLAELDARVAAELERFATVRLAPAFPHPHPSTWDLERFTGPLEPRRFGEPSLVLVSRDDRLWGASPAAQARNLARLWQLVRAELPEAGAAVVGLGTRWSVPEGVEDLRADAPDADVERRWMATLAGADLAVGVHGSNMLVPSALAAATLELVPEDRFANVPQASLVVERDPLEALVRRRYLYGDATLDDVSPERAARLALFLLTGAEPLLEHLTGPAAGVGDGPVPERSRSAPYPPAGPEPSGGLLRALRRRGGR